MPLQNVNDTFPRLHAMKVTVEQIREALADSELLSVDADFNLSRKRPFEMVDLTDQTVYIKGFPRNIGFQQIQTYLEKAAGRRPALVVFRKNMKGAAKGSVEVIFKNPEEAKEVVAFFGDQKAEDPAKAEKCHAKFKGCTLDRARAEALMDYADFLKENLTVLPLKLHAEAEEAQKEEEKETRTRTYVKGLILKIGNVGKLGLTPDGKECDPAFKPASEALGDQQVTRQLFNRVFDRFGEVKFVDFQVGQDWAYLRFKESSPDAAANAVLENEKAPIVLGGQKVTLGVLAGDEELKYWNDIMAAGDRKWQKNGIGGKKKGGKGKW